MDVTFKRGAHVWYHQRAGGYGYPARVPANVVRHTAKRVTIVLALQDGSNRTIHVSPLNLSRRVDDRSSATPDIQPTIDARSHLRPGRVES